MSVALEDLEDRRRQLGVRPDIQVGISA